jgi:integrase
MERVAGKERTVMGEHLFRRGRIWHAWVYNSTGERQKFSTGCTDKAAARLVLAQKERETADPDTARKKAAKLGGAIDLLTNDRESLVKAGKRSSRTVDFYETCARSWFLYAGRMITNVPPEKLDKVFTVDERENLIELGKQLALIDAGDERFVDSFILYRRANGVSEHTIAKALGTFRAALKLAKRARIWAGDLSNIFQRFESGYEPVQHWMTHEDVTQLLDAIILPNRRAYVSFILATGAELAGVERAERADVGPELVRVRGSKNAHRDRLVPIVTDWQRDLLAYVAEHADGKGALLFSPWANALRSIRKACIRAQVKHMNRHALRHTFAHWMKQEGVQHSELYVAMGHSTTAMLDRIYGRAEGSELASAMSGSIAERRAALRLIQGGKGQESSEKATG